MNLLDGWKERLRQAEEEERQTRTLPTGHPDLARASLEVRVAASPEKIRQGVQDLRSAPLAAISLAVSPGQGRQRPVAIAIGAWATSGEVFSTVLDLRGDGAGEALKAIFGLHLPIVVHDVKPLLLDLWALGVDPNLPSLYDTWVAAAAIHLGAHHDAGPRDRQEGEAERIRREAELAARRDALLSLEGQTNHYCLSIPIPPRATGTIPGVDVRLLAARAIWTLHVYQVQQADLLRNGLHAHLYTIEFPFSIANARIEWRGVHVDRDRLERLREGARRVAAHHATTLRRHGIEPPGSTEAFQRRMRQLAVGLGPLDERSLEALEARHPVIRAFRLHRRYRSLARQEWLTGALCDTENRIHSEHHQLAAATGRNSCRRPNLAGLGRVLRPVVTAPLGRALVELDYCQMELAVAGAEYRDDEIVSAYNAGEDIYSIAAQALFKGDYEASERTMAAPQFRQRHPDLREKAKAVLLSILYGAGIGRIALALGVSEATASRRVDLLAARFPGLFRGLEESVALGTARGHASIISGLRRPIMSNTSENAARRVLRNTPIQGSAAVVFKKAIIDLDRLFHGTEVWVVLPIHDSVLLECAAEEVRGVAERAAQAMKDAMRTYYPALQPRVDVNLACTDCWNKDGHADSIDRWLEDFDYSFDRPHRAVLQGEKQAREVAG